MERENRKFTEQDGVALVWDVEDGTEEIYFEYEDGERDIIWTGEDYRKAEKVFDKALGHIG